MDESEDDRIQSRLDQGESSEDDDADGGTVFTLHTSEDLPTPMDESVHNVCQIHEHTFQCGQLLRGLGLTRLVIATLATILALANASPRNPNVRIDLRSSTFTNLLVANLVHANGKSRG